MQPEPLTRTLQASNRLFISGIILVSSSVCSDLVHLFEVEGVSGVLGSVGTDSVSRSLAFIFRKSGSAIININQERGGHGLGVPRIWGPRIHSLGCEPTGSLHDGGRTSSCDAFGIPESTHWAGGLLRAYTLGVHRLVPRIWGP